MNIDKIDLSATNQVLAASPAPPAAQSAETGFSSLINSAMGGGAVGLDAIFQAASLKYGVPVNMLKAVAKAESDFRPNVTSKSGAMGIMQLMPGTAKALGVTDAYDPEQNIMGGAKYLSQMLDKFGGDTQLALAAYNAGPGNVTKYGGIPPFKETQNYVQTVMGHMGGDITAGSIAYGAAVPGTQGDAFLKSSLTEMFLMKIMEMEMKSSEDKDKSVF